MSRVIPLLPPGLWWPVIGWTFTVRSPIFTWARMWWSVFILRSQRVPRAGKFGKHWSVELVYQRSTENALGSLCFTCVYKNEFQNSNPRTRPLLLMLCRNKVRLSYEPFCHQARSKGSTWWDSFNTWRRKYSRLPKFCVLITDRRWIKYKNRRFFSEYYPPSSNAYKMQTRFRNFTQIYKLAAIPTCAFAHW
jgi:hypothetical protein